MALKDWEKMRKNKNPYITHSWINKKKGLLIEIHYDIGFRGQRNMTVYNYKNQQLTGYEHVYTYYGNNEKDALNSAKKYMENN